MIRDITIGQYYPGKSVLHQLDPRVKLFGVFLYIISVFLFDSIPGFVLLTAFLVGIIALSKVPVKFIFKGLKAVLILMLITALFNLFMTPGEAVVKFWVFKVTKQGVMNTGYMLVRLSYLVIGSSVLTLTTTPTRLTDGMETSLGFLNVIKVPVHEISMMMSIALRFIPILLEETDKIMKAQMARGADFESGSFVKRIKNMVPLLVPLFVSAWRRASDLAMAMEARCYRGGIGRTKMKPLKYVRQDGMAYLVILAYFAGMIALKILL